MAKPRTLTLCLAFILVWVGVNGAAPLMGWTPFDHNPFELLELTAAVAAFSPP